VNVECSSRLNLLPPMLQGDINGSHIHVRNFREHERDGKFSVALQTL
jgi:hypothetical protein